MLGCSVTQRIREVKQPRGGYLNPKTFVFESLGDGKEILVDEENTNSSLVGLTVDYLTRFMTGSTPKEAFKISLLGAEIIGDNNKARKLLKSIKGLDDKSIISAVKLSGYDVCIRAMPSAYRKVESPNIQTIKNIRLMVERGLHFFEIYGDKVLDGFTFEGGYTNIVGRGDGDFTTKDTLWDFKVSKKPPSKDNTLQLLMYWRMGLHSIYPEFKDIKFLGIFNPRLNLVYRISVESISNNIIAEVEKEVIGY